MSKKIAFFFALLLVSGMLLAACGGGGGSTDDAAARGEELFNQPIVGSEPGCNTCHSLTAGTVIVGPSLAGIGTTAATRVGDETAEEYLRQSILEPDAYLVEGFTAGVMSKNWADTLTDDQLNDVVAYLLTIK